VLAPILISLGGLYGVHIVALGQERARRQRARTGSRR
jgi:hypothetical protein